MATTSLSSLLNVKRGKYPTDTPAWTQFVRDHRASLMATATARAITRDEQQTYRFRLVDLLRTLGYDHSVTWIVLWLNDLDGQSAFDGVDELTLPSDETLSSLYTSYSTFITAEEAAATTLAE